MLRTDQLHEELEGECFWQRFGLAQKSRWGGASQFLEQRRRPGIGMWGFSSQEDASDGLQKLLEVAKGNEHQSRES